MRDRSTPTSSTTVAAQTARSSIDVREPAEYVAGHVPGAVLIPMGQLPSRVDELDRAAPVYVICATGNRSGAMTDLLAAAGFDAYSVAGGTVGLGRASGRDAGSTGLTATCMTRAP